MASNNPVASVGGSLEVFAELPEQTLGYLHDYYTDGTDLREIVRSSWSDAWKSGRWIDTHNAISFPLAKGNEQGLLGVLKPNRNAGKPWRLTYAGPNRYNTLDAIERKSPVPTSLFNLAYIDWSRMEGLLDDALPETWGFGDGDYTVFRSYLLQTYSRLVYEGKVLISDRLGLLAFNTGLVTPSYDDIIMCFRKDSASKSGWSYAGHGVEGESGLGKELLDAFPELPKRAQYVTDIVDLVFDSSRRVAPDYRHIIVDNLGRFPPEYLDWRLYRHPDLAQMLDDARALSEQDAKRGEEELHRIGHAVWDVLELRNGIRDDVENALRKTSRRADWNLRTAIPAYYPRRKTMSLLLPLCMVKEGTPDLVMVVSLSQTGIYKGETVLDMNTAYINARLVNRPESEWLHL